MGNLLNLFCERKPSPPPPRVEIILGCMFSGKSSELIRRCRRYKSIGFKVLLINSTLDTRCSDNRLKTHNNEFATGIKVKDLLSLEQNPKFQEANVVGVDEAQFFEDIVAFVLLCEKLEKTVIIAGLDGNYQRQPFGKILECIPLCDSVDKLVALDMVSNDGSAAIFTKRSLAFEKVSENIVVGGSEIYLATNRKNYCKTT
jgi:thymidine kinase